MVETLKRIFIKGGVTTPNELKQVIQLAKALNLESISFGSRQDILLPVKENQEHLLKTYFPEFKQDIEQNLKFQNIVSSYVCTDVFSQTSWLSGTTYLYLHEEFKYNPTLKINLVDPQQNLIPIYNGHLNFIASKNEDYWYLNLNLPGWNKDINYPVLVFTWNISKIAEAIENEYQNYDNVQDLYNRINELVDSNNKVITEPLNIPHKPFPYYEGMNKMGISQYWLGLYWRNNKYDINFLDEFCDFCMDYRISRICITPWKSFIVKGIEKEYKFMMEKFLGQRGINVRHSSLELNWHLPVNDPEALKLKRFIVKSFDQNDISTYGLTFGYHDRSEHPQYFTSMIIEKNPSPKMANEFETINSYNVLYCKNFNPNTREYIPYAQNVEEIELPGLLMKLSQLYFLQLDSNSENIEKPKENKDTGISENKVHQCKDCMTVYDEEIGDAEANIEPGVAFEDLPSDYTCNLCGAPKNTFQQAVLQK
ncbi:rubredoxin [Wenyingzhuangia sp. 2_MG-2023]|uniref:rubredoxin n=1 Tax=Wenyingzhuangia sp. 2_MG-2023 TaxID=3062639 RepID=UPI0026E3A389|nr:rubredoxin [Wenyingzhuangia sp. 2_MG-2023]MDO6737955.1 rubredoxin [Wenyingzhuangia sp. 2_MG-2023]MDO6802691.1 rubredoxin [Wenyingzhuangia sp. 1_MG-2023]